MPKKSNAQIERELEEATAGMTPAKRRAYLDEALLVMSVAEFAKEQKKRGKKGKHGGTRRRVRRASRGRTARR